MDAESHNQRMKDIQRRKAERRKKQIFKNRCIAAVFCLILLILVIFGVKSCVSGMIKSNQERKAASVTPSPIPTTTPVPKDTEGISQDFYKNSALVGNSFIDGMIIYDLIDGADYFAKVGLNVKSASTESTDTGTVPVIEELNSTKVYNKIFMMFGENELGWSSTQTFSDEYTKLVKKVKKYQPEAKIYLLSITPITAEESEKSIDNTTNENIRKFNRIIKQVAEAEDVIYCDIYSAVANNEGDLPKGAATDGIHFDNEYYKKCLIYIQEHYSDNNTLSSSSSYNNSDTDSSSNSSSSSSGGTSSSGSTSSNKSSGSKTSSGSDTSSKSGQTSGNSSSGSGTSSSSGSISSSGSSTSGSTSSGTSAVPSKSLDD